MAISTGGNVLICDRNHDLSDALRLVFEDEGYDVTVARSVDEGLDVLRGSRHGMIVVWDATPNVGGLEMLSAVLEDDVRPARHAYVLLTTGPVAQLRAVTRLLPTLKTSVVQMPFSVQTLLRTAALSALRLGVGAPAALQAIS